MYLKAAALLVEPTEKQLGRAHVFSVQTDRHTGRNMQVQKIESFQYTPLRETMQRFLQQPGVMSSISQQEKLDDDSIYLSYRDGLNYKKSSINPEKIFYYHF